MQEDHRHAARGHHAADGAAQPQRPVGPGATERGVPVAQAYNVTMYLMAGLLVLGFFANLSVRPVAERYYMSDEDVARERGMTAAAH